MNQPIGIPSGWEETAAWAYASLAMSAQSLSNEYFNRSGYTFPAVNYCDKELPHDWRVED